MGATAKVIVLKGDKRKPESAEHHIEFPGGVVSVCRLEDGSYWAHINANTGVSHPATDGFKARTARVLDGRISYDSGATEWVRDLPEAQKINHIALLIAPPNNDRGEQS